MPTSVQSSGAQVCVLNTDHVLAAITGPAGGAHYALVLDVNALVAGERLFAYVKRKTRAADTERELLRVLVAANVTASPILDSIILRLPAGIDGTFGIRQEGGVGRTIPWSVERVDG